MTTALRRHEPVEEEKPERKGRRWTLWASVVVVALVVVCGILYVVLPSGKNAAAPAYTGPAVVVEQPTDTPAGVCNFPKLDATDVVTIAAPDTTWALTGSMASPSSQLYGPLHRDAGIPGCFARTPQGALLAAAGWITARQDPKTDKLALLNAMVAHTAGYDQMVSDFQSIGTASSEADVPTISQIAGFRMLFFDRSHAEIEIVTRATSGNSPGYMASVVYVLVWADDDWKIAPVLDGNAPITRPVTALAPPYIAYSGA